MPLVVAAVSVIAASNYLAYLIGRKQVTYEELRSQVDRVVQLVGHKRFEEELALTTPKQRQEKLEQTGSALNDLTTSTIKGKTMVAPEPAPPARQIAASPSDGTGLVPPDRAVGLQPPELPVNAATKHREVHGVVHQRAARRQKASRGPADPWAAERSRQLTTATSAAPDASLAGQ
jgi:hypothetical protein